MFKKEEVRVTLGKETVAVGVKHVNKIQVTHFIVNETRKIKINGRLYSAPAGHYDMTLPLSMDIDEFGEITTFSLNTGFSKFASDNFDTELEKVMGKEFAPVLEEVQEQVVSEVRANPSRFSSEAEVERFAQARGVELMSLAMGITKEFALEMMAAAK